MTRYNKFIAALVAGIEEVVTLNVLHGTAQTVAVTVGAVLGAVAVHLIPNGAS